MRRIQVVICSVEEDAPDEMTELACFDLPATDVTACSPRRRSMTSKRPRTKRATPSSAGCCRHNGI